ncbi:PLP-dependent aminotransferase family protein [Streptomyces sp. NPDC051219]|uniref:aminotransferase-like domain-containing protein n=1 Tax=Streptomyces sp. NPDC051219 TaxID=3155283 RepID=UPI0034296E48
MPDYLRVAEEVAAEISTGRLRPGDRLPTQRAFARSRGIANSTAIRVYGELVRRGLVVGEVGRGTFVRAAPPAPGSALAEATGTAPVNLELNYPVAEGQSELMVRSLEGLLRADSLDEATGPAAAAGTPEARRAAAGLLARGGWQPDADRVLFAGNGRQAIAAAVSSLVPPGGRLGVEALTYPLVKGIAGRLGVALVPIATDGEGLRPDALAAAHRSTPLGAVYVQPTLHNPLSVTAGEGRRAELAAVLDACRLHAVEDTTWAFLAPDAPPPLAAYAPGRTVLVDSLSKRLAPGLSVGFLVAPGGGADGRPEARTGGSAGGSAGGPCHALARTLRSGAWTAGRFNLEAATRWTVDGTVAAVVETKRKDAATRQALVREHLAGFRVHTDVRAYYCWWELPTGCRAETFVAAAAGHGIAVTPGSAFAVGSRTAPDAVRIGLASPPVQTLAYALRTLAGIARG